MQMKNKKIILYGIFVMTIMYSLEGTVFNLILSSIAHRIGFKAELAALFISIKGVSMVVSIPIIERFVFSKNGNVRLSLLAVIYSMSFISLNFISSYLALVIVAIVLGVTSSIFITILIPTLISMKNTNNFSLYMGIILGGASLLGAILSPGLISLIEIGSTSNVILLMSIMTVLLISIPTYFLEIPKNAVENKKRINHNVCKQDLLIYIFSAIGAFVAGHLFLVTIVLKDFNYSNFLILNGASFLLIGSAVYKVVFGKMFSKREFRTVISVATFVSLLGIVAVSTKINLLALFGLFNIGSIISLMMLTPSILFKKLYEDEEKYRNKLKYANMIVFLSYYSTPFITELNKSIRGKILVFICAILIMWVVSNKISKGERLD